MAGLKLHTAESERVFGNKAGPNCCKSEPATGSADSSPLCPQCKTKKVWRDGLRFPMFGEPIQRWLCRDCGYRFSDPTDVLRAKKEFEQVETIETKILKSQDAIVMSRQICVKETKNLAAEQKQMEVPRGNEINPQIAIAELVWYLKRKNYSEDTINSYQYNLRYIKKLGVNLFEPSTFVDKMTELTYDKDKKENEKTITDIRKYNLAKAYHCFLKYYKIKNDLPKYKVRKTERYLPPEEHIDIIILVAGSDQLATFTQLVKETGGRPGEIFRAVWEDIDIANKQFRISKPEKGCNPRTLPISDKLLKQLLALPHTNGNKIFNYAKKDYIGRSYRRARKRAIKKTGNTELSKIDFVNFRYWRATEEYYREDLHDYDRVQYLLGHTSMKYLQIYKQLILTRSKSRKPSNYISRECRNSKQERQAIEDGFEYVSARGSVHYYRKAKPQ